ncbi:MAG: tRNA-dihydrouridine synthase family protein [Desulfobacterales bacterium]|nr:tRNA-dihydrouridine synthase family protein [Desulfobacterales bacterium]MDJ0988365.1 tRNA-dihydrouridine synthase family protein [Desulfobacterales bacterium]
MITERTLRHFLTQPLAVGSRVAPGRLFMAPMAKLGNTAFRKIVADFGGCGLLFSEMCWAGSVPCGNGHDQGGFTWRPDENLTGLVCQLFGNDPATMARAAAIVADEGFFGVDINFGCAVAAVCKKGCGAALLRTPQRAAAIVGAIRRAVSIPVFVKFRTGWQDDPQTAVSLARRFEDAGADALTYHPRVAPDRRTRPPRWDYIGQVKAAVGIPVIGNGDVFDRRDCARMLARTNCDGVALGRLALARPWIFAEWTSDYRPRADVYLRSALELTERLEACYGPQTGRRRFHRYAAYFTANFRYGHFLYGRLCRPADLAGVRTVLRQFLSEDPEIVERPSMHRFR